MPHAVPHAARLSDPGGTVPVMDTPDPVELVRLAATFYRSPSRRLQVARDRWGLSMTQFAMLVNAAVDDPTVAAAVPVEVRMLRERRDRGLRTKSPLRRAG